MVIVLDNAATEAQVLPLLPGAPGCVVLVTSRRRLAGLDHTHTLSLDTLPLLDAIALLRQTAGEDRLAGQPPELVAELVELCGRLPLAIRIAAARLRSHPTWDLAHLVRGCATSSTGWPSCRPASAASPPPSTCPTRTWAPTSSARTGGWVCIPARTSTSTPRPRCSTPPCGRRVGCSSSCWRPTCCRNPPRAGTGSTT